MSRLEYTKQEKDHAVYVASQHLWIDVPIKLLKRLLLRSTKYDYSIDWMCPDNAFNWVCLDDPTPLKDRRRNISDILVRFVWFYNTCSIYNSLLPSGPTKTEMRAYMMIISALMRNGLQGQELHKFFVISSLREPLLCTALLHLIDADPKLFGAPLDLHASYNNATALYWSVRFLYISDKCSLTELECKEKCQSLPKDLQRLVLAYDTETNFKEALDLKDNESYGKLTARELELRFDILQAFKNCTDAFDQNSTDRNNTKFALMYWGQLNFFLRKLTPALLQYQQIVGRYLRLAPTLLAGMFSDSENAYVQQILGVIDFFHQKLPSALIHSNKWNRDLFAIWLRYKTEYPYRIQNGAENVFGFMDPNVPASHYYTRKLLKLLERNTLCQRYERHRVPLKFKRVHYEEMRLNTIIAIFTSPRIPLQLLLAFLAAYKKSDDTLNLYDLAHCLLSHRDLTYENGIKIFQLIESVLKEHDVSQEEWSFDRADFCTACGYFGAQKLQMELPELKKAWESKHKKVVPKSAGGYASMIEQRF